jgi:neutral ceramidase
MKRLLFIALICLPIFLVGQGKSESVIKAGFSEISITPDKPIVMSGYGGRTDPFKGVHDSLFAQAMYLTLGNEEVLVITCDLIGHSRANVLMVKGMINHETGIPEENIFLSAVHNHGGPSNGTYTSEEKLSDDVKAYVKVLYNEFVEMSVEAKRVAQPVRIGFNSGECFVNINRRAVFSKDEIWLGRNSQGVCDHDLSIIKFTDLQGNLKAVHMNYPCHGTTTGNKNYQLTGDWPGISAQMMKEKLGGDVIVMVTVGASADINPIYGPTDYFREVNAVAYGVASIALDLIEKCNASEVGELYAATISADFAGKKRWKSNFTQDSEPAEDVPVYFSAFRVGDIVMAGISGELFTEIGMNVKSRIPHQTSIITHCNGVSGYICTDASYLEGGYEPQVSPFMPGTEEKIENMMVELISSLGE